MGRVSRPPPGSGWIAACGRQEKAAPSVTFPSRRRIVPGGGRCSLTSAACLSGIRKTYPALPSTSEVKALRRTKRLLQGWDWSFFLALLFSCFAFGRIIADTSWDVSPVNFIVTASIALAFWLAFFVRLFWVRKQVLRT